MMIEQPEVAFQLDRASPVPLFHQLATGIRYRIATGDIAPGDDLPSLRDGGELWGVNLHTVRRAYEELEEAGLVRTVPRLGTRVLPSTGRTADEGLEAFLRETLRTARTRYGLGRRELVTALSDQGDDAGVVVVECSRTLARWMAEELQERWAVDARPAVLGSGGDLDEGRVVSSFFHYVEMRSRLASRLADLAFVRIRPDPRLLAEVAGFLEDSANAEVLLLETEASMAHNVAADLEHQLGHRVRVRVCEDPRSVLEDAHHDAPILVSPLNWDRLDERSKALPAVRALRFSIEPGDLERLGTEMGWPPA